MKMPKTVFSRKAVFYFSYFLHKCLYFDMESIPKLLVQDFFVQTNQIQMHYIRFESAYPEAETLLLMHGLTANAHAFDGVVLAGLSQKFNVISVDLRGRGLSDKPDADYSMAAHAHDIIGLLDALGLAKIYLGGHSYGSFLSMYLAAHYPERIKKLILMDAAAQMHPDTRNLLKPSLSRLDKVFPSFDAYLATMKEAPYLFEAWDEAMTSYYRADVGDNADGTVQPYAKPQHIEAAIEDPLTLDWENIIRKIPHPALFIHAKGAYGLPGAPPLLPEEGALATVHMLANCHYVPVEGNHQTMLYGQGAKQIATQIEQFLSTS